MTHICTRTIVCYQILYAQYTSCVTFNNRQNVQILIITNVYVSHNFSKKELCYGN